MKATPHRPSPGPVESVEHSLLLATLEATADGILVVDRAGKIVRFNQRFARLWKLPREILDSGDDDRAIAYVLSQLKDPDAFVDKVRALYAHPDQESFDVLEFRDGRVFERYSVPQRADGTAVGRVWSFRDVTQRVNEERERAAAEARARRRLERLESLWRLVADVELTGDALTDQVLGEGRRSLELDYATISEVDGERLITHLVSTKLAPSHSGAITRLEAAVASIATEAGSTVASPDLKEDPAFRDDARVKSSELRAAIATPLRVGERLFVLGFASREPRSEPFTHEDREYIELLAAYFGRRLRIAEQEGQITYLAYHDSLTGLENRRRFLERIAEAASRSRRSGHKFALMYIDLDRFKDVNDSYGHIVGDAVLEEAGRRLRSVVRVEDPAARFGGDEFAVLLTDWTRVREVEALASRICGTLAEPFSVDGREVQVSASVGIAVYPDDGRASTELLRCADAALYRAKEQGRARFSFYSEELAAQLMQRRQLQVGLRRAVDNQQFDLVFQPVLRLDGEVEAVEALLRWNHPDRGTVYPGEFVPVAEETGLMVPIGNWVIHASARQLATWIRQGYSFRMAVNISVTQLQDASFVDRLTSELAEHDVPASLFEIEITESSALRDPEAAQAVVTECRRLGIRVALDDFGTHYASLSHLKKLPFDIIKIDRSFVRGLPSDRNDCAIVRSILALGANFGCSVVAEGVETEEQAGWLRDNGCRLVQGFLLGEPMSSRALSQWMAARQVAGPRPPTRGA